MQYTKLGPSGVKRRWFPDLVRDETMLKLLFEVWIPHVWKL